MNRALPSALLFALCVYSAFSFMCLQPNPLAWDDESRQAAAVLLLFAGMLTLLFSLMSNSLDGH